MGKRNPQGVVFAELFDKPASVEFTAPDQSSDGGVVLLKAIDEKMKLTERLARAIRDRRQAGKVEHEIRAMLQERIFGIACGYPDCNDAARLTNDVAMKLVCERREASVLGYRLRKLNVRSGVKKTRREPQKGWGSRN